MKKILVPVDFSESTDITISYALEIAKKYGSEIRLFHTYFDQFITADSSFPDAIDMSTMYNEEVLKEIIHNSEKSMELLYDGVVNRLREGPVNDITLSKIISGGEIETEILDLCSQYHPDLIIMGTRGKGGGLQVWGKVSTYIINHVKIPVLTLPVMKKYSGFNNVMFATDFSPGSVELLHTLSAILLPFKPHIHCVHFVLKGKKADEYQKMDQLITSLPDLNKQGTISFEIIDVMEETQQSIDAFVKEKNISLIAFEPHKRGLLFTLFTKKITKKNLFGTNIPLLSLPFSGK